MSKKEIVFGAKRDGITWLFTYDRATFKRAKAGAKRLGLSLSELVCRYNPFTGAPRLQEEQRKFTDEDRASAGIKIQITEIDPFTRLCFSRQAARMGFKSIEEYVIDGALCALASNEDDSIVDPQTGEIVLTGHELGSYQGCNVDKDAPKEPPFNFIRVPIPPGAIVESCT